MDNSKLENGSRKDEKALQRRKVLTALVLMLFAAIVFTTTFLSFMGFFGN